MFLNVLQCILYSLLSISLLYHLILLHLICLNSVLDLSVGCCRAEQPRHLSGKFLTKPSCKWTQSAVSSISDPPLQFIYHPHNNPRLPHRPPVTTGPHPPSGTCRTGGIYYLRHTVHPSGWGSIRTVLGILLVQPIRE